MSHLRLYNTDETAVARESEARLIAPLYIAAATVGGAFSGLFWGWIITRFAAPTGHPIKRGALIGAGIGGGLAVVSVLARGGR